LVNSEHAPAGAKALLIVSAAVAGSVESARMAPNNSAPSRIMTIMPGCRALRRLAAHGSHACKGEV
jgi:hypothetical protein